MFFSDKRSKPGDAVTFARDGHGAKAGQRARIRRVRRGWLCGEYYDLESPTGKKYRGVGSERVIPD